MPMPPSRTENSIRSPSFRAASSQLAPSGEYLSALSSRFDTTRLSSWRSVSSSGRCGEKVLHEAQQPAALALDRPDRHLPYLWVLREPRLPESLREADDASERG